jgi:hypothetical protein
MKKKLKGKVIFQFLYMERLYYYNLINIRNNNKLDFLGFLKAQVIYLHNFIKIYRIEHPWKYRGIRFCIFGLIRLSGCGSILPIIGLGKGAYLVSQMPKQDILMCFTDLSWKKILTFGAGVIGIWVIYNNIGDWGNKFHNWIYKKPDLPETVPSPEVKAEIPRVRSHNIKEYFEEEQRLEEQKMLDKKSWEKQELEDERLWKEKEARLLKAKEYMDYSFPENLRANYDKYKNLSISELERKIESKYKNIQKYDPEFDVAELKEKKEIELKATKKVKYEFDVLEQQKAHAEKLLKSSVK